MWRSGGITPSFAQLNNVYNTGRLTATGRSIIPESEPVATASPIVASYGASVEMVITISLVWKIRPE